MGRSQSPTAPAPGGVGRVGGGGWAAIRRAVLTAAGVAATAGGVGCLSVDKATRSMKQSLGLGAVKPATVLTVAFQPQVQHLPDPTQDEAWRAGIVGQLFLTAADGRFTEVDGDLYVMADDVTPRPVGQPPAVREMWHFDKASLRRLKTKDERFGDTYALFLPYPPTWKDVAQIAITTQYVPKPEDGSPAGPKLNGSPQTITLDYTPPGSKPVWTEVAKAGGKLPTAPVEMKGMPDLGKAIAQGRVGAAMAGPAAATGTAAAPATLPLPPQQDLTKNPYTVMPGPNGSTVYSTGYALPPGQTVPPGWTVDPATKALVPPAGTAPWAVAPPGGVTPDAPGPGTPPAPPAPNGYRAPAAIPISPNYPTAPAVAPPGVPLPNAHQPLGALPPTAATFPMTPAAPPADGNSVPLPAIPPGPGVMPGAAPASGIDPNSPVGPGPWANGPSAPSAPGFPAMTVPAAPTPPVGGNTFVIPRR